MWQVGIKGDSRQSVSINSYSIFEDGQSKIHHKNDNYEQLIKDEVKNEGDALITFKNSDEMEEKKQQFLTASTSAALGGEKETRQSDTAVALMQKK